MIDLQAQDSLDTNPLRNAARRLAQEVHFKQAIIDKLKHEHAVLKRLKFAEQSEACTGEQKSPKRQALPPHLLRREFRHDPYADLHDVLERLPSQPASRIGEWLAHHWTPCPGN